MVEPIDMVVVPADFPELAALVWNRDPLRPIGGDEALALYERNWRHVDRTHLTPRELALIQELSKRFGRGHLVVA